MVNRFLHSFSEPLNYVYLEGLVDVYILTNLRSYPSWPMARHFSGLGGLKACKGDSNRYTRAGDTAIPDFVTIRRFSYDVKFLNYIFDNIISICHLRNMELV